MTTIAYRNGVMAAESGVWIGDAAFPWARKLAKGNDGTLYGVSGSGTDAAAFLKWIEDGEEGPMPRGRPIGDEMSIVILKVPLIGPISSINAIGEEVYPDAPYIAWGAGATVALGAMFAGADAETAIKAALTHSSGAIGRVQSIFHDKD
jgi:hypothetical protein